MRKTPAPALNNLHGSAIFMGSLRKKSRRANASAPILGLNKCHDNSIEEDETMTHHTHRTTSDPTAEIEGEAEVIGPYTPWPRRARPRFRTRWTDARSGFFPACSSHDLPFSS
jgi:hypothetical protein